MNADYFSDNFKENIKNYAKNHAGRGVFKKRNRATMVMYGYFNDGERGRFGFLAERSCERPLGL
ncbi:hypothetical protein [Piscirickettsia salmonis]|uniref:hypothetical protein n=1 Tax=Piscirickettsia salmonis TaxID=1238 RepID=UPI00064C9F05|nr:hypothetical protein [Piscirickettsia salmonis]KLV34634.1 hypothetical protein AB894_13000 [Piscirickettsia salmonis]